MKEGSAEMQALLYIQTTYYTMISYKDTNYLLD